MKPNRPKRDYFISKSIKVLGNYTSLKLEPEVWRGLNEISEFENYTKRELVDFIATKKPANQSVSSAVRIFLLNYYRDALKSQNKKLRNFLSKK